MPSVFLGNSPKTVPKCSSKVVLFIEATEIMYFRSMYEILRKTQKLW